MCLPSVIFRDMGRLRENIALLVAFGLLSIFWALTPALYQRPRTAASTEMQVALPLFVQVLIAGGDRYLAANLAGFRTLVASTENMKEENYRIQAIVQSDAAWLNPAHEDNYYLAAAFLPWNGQLDAAQQILSRAILARPFDWQPPFYYGFDLMYFSKQPVEGANWLRLAADRSTDELQNLQLQQMAASWLAKGGDVDFSVRLIRAMARQAKHKPFAAFLEKRALRLENLQMINKAVERFKQTGNTSPLTLETLVKLGFMRSVPKDPFDEEYTLSEQGSAQVGAKHPEGAR